MHMYDSLVLDLIKHTSAVSTSSLHAGAVVLPIVVGSGESLVEHWVALVVDWPEEAGFKWPHFLGWLKFRREDYLRSSGPQPLAHLAESQVTVVFVKILRCAFPIRVRGASVKVRHETTIAIVTCRLKRFSYLTKCLVIVLMAVIKRIPCFLFNRVSMCSPLACAWAAEEVRWHIVITSFSLLKGLPAQLSAKVLNSPVWELHFSRKRSPPLLIDQFAEVLIFHALFVPCSHPLGWNNRLLALLVDFLLYFYFGWGSQLNRAFLLDNPLSW